MDESVADTAHVTMLNNPGSSEPVRKGSPSEVSTGLSADGISNIKSLSLAEDDSATKSTAPPVEEQGPVDTDSESMKAENLKVRPSRAALIAKAKAAKAGAVFTAPSAAAKRSARLKTTNYKPILAAGKGSIARLEQVRKEAAEKKAKEQEEAAARVKKNKKRQFLNNTIKRLLQDLPDEAIEELPEDYYKLSGEEKLRILFEAHVKHKRDSVGDLAREIVGRVQDAEQRDHILREIERLEEVHGLKKSTPISEEHEGCICDECKDALAESSGAGRIVSKVENPSE